MFRNKAQAGAIYPYLLQAEPYLHTVCPGSIDPFYIVTYYIKWVTTSWTYCKYDDVVYYVTVIANGHGLLKKW